MNTYTESNQGYWVCQKADATLRIHLTGGRYYIQLNSHFYSRESFETLDAAKMKLERYYNKTAYVK